VFDVYDSLI